MTITFDPASMPRPYIIAFTSPSTGSGRGCEGLQIGVVIEWLNKLWQVRLRTGMGCFVMPEQVEWLC